ncbi:MAG: hypothetical protein KJ549_06400, partial [Alphaproteobacteria bacterium]|nr:hypothetical protein [Alphaproteobacteria bacterium]MBU1463157.1 hypothetical protein [Alphaproteobacteria bacterium]
AYCVNLKADNTNCGACGTACKPGEVCSTGKCAVSCQTGLTRFRLPCRTRRATPPPTPKHFCLATQHCLRDFCL